MFDKIKTYIRSQLGATAAFMAVTLPVVVGSVGMAVDLAQAHLVRERLANALDAAALAAASSSGSTVDLEARLQEFFDANYPPEKVGTAYDLTLEMDGDELTVSAKADYSTTFLRVLGIDEITVDAETKVQREVQGIEVALVLDVTGSMRTNNNIGALRTAATNFVDILFGRAKDPEDIRVGLVPYSSSVNVGSYGFGEYPDGSAYDTAFVTQLPGIDYDLTDNQEWHGCILAHEYPDDTFDHEGPWEMYRYERERCGWVGNWPNRTYQCWTDTSSPNTNCPDAMVQPLSSDQDGLLDAISGLQANGYTLGNFGMVWGWRVISPEFPYTEGSDWDSPFWRKSVIMMTDGANTMERNYTAYGPTDDHDVSPSDLNERFAEVCEYMKDMGITIYTVTFSYNISSYIKDYYRQCASDDSKYIDAPDQDDLIEAFERISNELANLHISQ